MALSHGDPAGPVPSHTLAFQRWGRHWDGPNQNPQCGPKWELSLSAWASTWTVSLRQGSGLAHPLGLMEVGVRGVSQDCFRSSQLSHAHTIGASSPCRGGGGAAVTLRQLMRGRTTFWVPRPPRPTLPWPPVVAQATAIDTDPSCN